MDPLSIIAGVVSIAAAACSGSQALFELVEDIKSGPEQIHAIARDAHALNSIVSSLHIALRHKDMPLIVSDDADLVQMIANLGPPLSSCQAVLCQLMVKIEAHVKPASDGRGFRMSKRDLKWSFYAKTEVKNLTTRLEATKSTLDNALGAVNTLVAFRLLSMGKASAAREVRISTGSTNAGFALRRYVEESLSSGSVRHSSLPASTRNSQIGSSSEENGYDEDLPPPLPAGDRAGLLKSAMLHAFPDEVEALPVELLSRVTTIERPPAIEQATTIEQPTAIQQAIEQPITIEQPTAIEQLATIEQPTTIIKQDVEQAFQQAQEAIEQATTTEQSDSIEKSDSIGRSSGTLIPIAPLGEDVDELEGGAVPVEFPPDTAIAGLAVETLEAMTSASLAGTVYVGWNPVVCPGALFKVEDGLKTRGAEACVHVGPKELQAASSPPAIAPTAVSSAPKIDHTLSDTTTRDSNSNRASILNSTLLRSLVDADSRFLPTAFFSPVTFNTLTEILDPARRISENNPVVLTALLQLGIRYGDAVDTKSLLDVGADPNAKDSESGKTALESASLLTDYPVKIANLLYQRGADVNQADEEGWSLLHYATLRGKVKELKWLLEHGASIEVRTKVKRTISGATLDFVTPLQIAASSGHFQALACLDELLKAGAETDPTANQGYGAIHFAARGGSCPAVAKLLTAGARLNHSNNPTRATPLLEAIAHQQLDVLRYLLCLEADCMDHEIWSYDPYVLAEERRQVEDVPRISPTQNSIREELWKLVKDGSGNALYRYRINNDPRCIGVGPISYVPKSVRRFNRGEVNDKGPSNLPLRREIDDRRISFEFGAISTVSTRSSSVSSESSDSQLECLRSSPGSLRQTQDSDSDLSENMPPKHSTSQPQEASDSTPFDRNRYSSVQESSHVKEDHWSTADSASIDTFSPTTGAVTVQHDDTQSQWKFEFCEPEFFEPSHQHDSVQQSQGILSDSPMGTMLIGIAL